jgi:hypothetical protein
MSDTTHLAIIVRTSPDNRQVATRGYLELGLNMGAPKMQPQGFVSVTSTASMQGKLELFGYGFDDRIVNPGDLLIVSSDYLTENGHKQKVEFTLKLRGRDMQLFVNEATIARNLWNENKHWLNAAVSTPNLDMRGKSEIRLSDQIENLQAFLNIAPPPPTLR